MELETDLIVVEIHAIEGISEALTSLDNRSNSRAILSTSEQNYIQAGGCANGFIIEKRSGSEDTHMHARPRGRPPLQDPPAPASQWWRRLLGMEFGLGPHDFAFDREEVIAAFEAYFEGAEDPTFLTWHPGYS